MTGAPLRWRRSPYCANGACGEVAFGPGGVFVRTTPRPDTVLRVPAPAWRAFIEAIKTDDWTTYGTGAA